MFDKSAANARVPRASVLGASLAALAIALVASPALAESSAGPGSKDLLGNAGLDLSVQREAQGAAATLDQRLQVTTPDPQILVANPGTPTTARDPVNVTGVGQMIVDAGGGSVGLCTGTLINPRTVIFAAHCVNGAAASNYGANSGGQAIGWGFEANTRANAAGQTDELVTWLLGGAGGAGKYKTNVAQAFYNSNYVSYNPLSLDPEARQFLYGDVALSSLDTPAANVPTWALLFSQLPAKPITADGTGYHVTITGYGRNGTGTSGSLAIDYRRRVAENTLGALASLDEFENFLFGTSSTALPQNLYWIDFDDPLRGSAQASVYDFNAWRDNAQPNEGITSSGDSGGPLILDRAYAKSLVIGVLSGGYTRFFNGQPSNGYGTASFYQPLYLYWDWIAANNFYHYVGSVAGNANWTDASHWVTNLDPAYQVIVGGQLVNGVPTAPGAGNTDQPGFGQACFQDAQGSECLDIASGTVRVGTNPIGTAGNGMDYANLSGEALVAEGAASQAALPRSEAVPMAAATLPPATLDNGLPGATNFVPNNYDGDRINRVKPRYFDVTLGAAGTTTLNTAVVIDRFTMAHGGATLDIQAGGSLTSLMSITQGTGTMQVNGALTSVGDYYMLTGGLNGTGVITTPFFTSTAGTISPGASGTAGSIGTLTFRGNTIFASGTTFMVDLGSGSLSDQIAVLSSGAAGSGQANLGGKLALSFVSGARAVDGAVYRILTAQNGVSGTFAAPTISAVIIPQLTYLANAVDLRITIGKYADVVDQGSAVQRSYAALLDASRASASSALSGLYGPLDMQDVAGVRSFMEGAAPRSESLRGATGMAASGASDRFFRQRVSTLRPGEATGQLAVNGNPLPMASQDSLVRAAAPMENGLGFADEGKSAGKLADDASGYLVAGYLNGSSSSMPTTGTAGRDKFNGWFAAFGLEKAVSDRATLGFGLSYANVDGTTSVAAQSAGARLVQGTVYGALATQKGLRLDLRVSAGVLSSDSQRTVTLVSTPSTLNLDKSAFAFAAEAGVGVDLSRNDKLTVTPRASLRYESLGFGRAEERGGPMALVIEREARQALEGRFGLGFSGQSGKVRPHLEVNYVHDFLNQPGSFAAGFVGGSAVAPFALPATDYNWAEVSGGLTFELSGRAALSVEADSSLFRKDLRSQSYRGRLTLKF